MARYRKLFPRVWRDEKFRSFDPESKLITLYVLTAQSNRIGLFAFSPAMAVEELGMSTDTFAESFRNVCRTLNWTFDEPSKVVFIPTWWKYNLPENGNVLKGCLVDLADVPDTDLIALFADNLEHLKNDTRNLRKTFAQTLAKCFPKRMGKPVAIQEQEQEQYQEQEFKERPVSEFRKPTVDEIRDYCHDRDSKVDPQEFVDHYESNGWKVGKNPMKDWQAAIRNWEKRDFGRNGKGNGLEVIANWGNDDAK